MCSQKAGCQSATKCIQRRRVRLCTESSQNCECLRSLRIAHCVGARLECFQQRSKTFIANARSCLMSVADRLRNRPENEKRRRAHSKAERLDRHLDSLQRLHAFLCVEARLPRAVCSRYTGSMAQLRKS